MKMEKKRDKVSIYNKYEGQVDLWHFYANLMTSPELNALRSFNFAKARNTKASGR